MAAPGTPNAISTPSFAITCTAASIALIFAIATSPGVEKNVERMTASMPSGLCARSAVGFEVLGRLVERDFDLAVQDPARPLLVDIPFPGGHDDGCNAIADQVP